MAFAEHGDINTLYRQRKAEIDPIRWESHARTSTATTAVHIVSPLNNNGIDAYPATSLVYHRKIRNAMYRLYESIMQVFL